MPYLGKGRWAIPIRLLKNQMLKKQTQQLAWELQNKVRASIREGCKIKNPQQVLKTFKSNIVETYHKHQRSIQPRIINTIKMLEKGVRETMNSATLTKDEINIEVNLINERIEALERKRRDEAYITGTARNWLVGETMSKHWVKSAKENTPRDTIRSLRNPLGDMNHKVTRSDEMAKLAREYYEALLSVDKNPLRKVDEEEFDKITNTLETKLDKEMQDDMSKQISSEDVEAALNGSASEKSPGLDRIPMEMWKLVHQQYKSAKDSEQHEYCNITEILAHIFNDIASHGITPGTDFNEGWMCPIYKKKEADNIANYRPITVLNTNYKIFTKVITTRLSTITPHLIHPVSS